MEQLDYNLLFRWFVGLSADDPVWDATVFCKNRDRLLDGDVAAQFLSAVLAQPRVKRLLSSEHFSVDGTLLEAWASMKSFRPKDGSGEPPANGRNGERNFRREKRSNETHQSTTDPDAKLYRKGDGWVFHLADGDVYADQASADGRFAAYGARDGHKLWESPMGTGGGGGDAQVGVGGEGQEKRTTLGGIEFFQHLGGENPGLLLHPRQARGEPGGEDETTCEGAREMLSRHGTEFVRREIAETDPSIMFSIGTTPHSASPRSTAPMTSGSWKATCV